MSKLGYQRFKFDFFIKTFVQEKQFEQWLRRFFYLNHELNIKYDSIYQDSFYVIFYELVTEGLDYAIRIMNFLDKGNNSEKIQWYAELVNGLSDLKLTFSKKEFEFIRYKRHNASHIFQNFYENNVFENGKIKSDKELNHILQIDKYKSDFRNLLSKHGCDRNFDIYMHRKLYAKIVEMYKKLEKIRMHYKNVLQS